MITFFKTRKRILKALEKQLNVNKEQIKINKIVYERINYLEKVMVKLIKGYNLKIK